MQVFSVWGTKTKDLSEFGEGLALYFYLLKWLSMLFLATALIAGAANIFFNVTGQYFGGKGGSLPRFRN